MCIRTRIAVWAFVAPGTVGMYVNTGINEMMNTTVEMIAKMRVAWRVKRSSAPYSRTATMAGARVMMTGPPTLASGKNSAL